MIQDKLNNSYIPKNVIKINTKIYNNENEQLFGYAYDGVKTHVVVGEDGIILHSDDLQNWFLADNRYQFVMDLISCSYGNGRFVAVGMLGLIVSSENGIKWSKHCISHYEMLYSVTYGNGVFVAVGEMGTIITSPDGQSWTQSSTSSKNDLFKVIYEGGLFMAVGEMGTVATSVNGYNWVIHHISDKPELHSVAYNNKWYVAISSDGIYIYTVGREWRRIFNKFDSDVILKEIIKFNNRFLIMSNDSLIIGSTSGKVWKEISELPVIVNDIFTVPVNDSELLLLLNEFIFILAI